MCCAEIFLQLPNGEMTAEQMRFAASCVKPYGADGCLDITTRANLQLRGVQLEDAGEQHCSNTVLNCVLYLPYLVCVARRGGIMASCWKLWHMLQEHCFETCSCHALSKGGRGIASCGMLCHARPWCCQRRKGMQEHCMSLLPNFARHSLMCRIRCVGTRQSSNWQAVLSL